MNNLILKQCDNKYLNLLSLLDNQDDKNLLIQFFEDKNTWASAVLDQFNNKNIYSEIIKPKMNIVIDIGGHIGMSALHFEPFAKNIHVIEPSKRHHNLLTKLLNNNPKFKTFNCAISNQTGPKEFFESIINNTQNALIQHGPTNSLGFIQCYKLVDFFNNNKIEIADFVKMDVEGEELEIILDSEFEELNERIKVLFCETHNTLPYPFNNFRQNQDLIIERLKNLGYTIQIKDDAVIATWI